MLWVMNSFTLWNFLSFTLPHQALGVHKTMGGISRVGVPWWTLTLRSIYHYTHRLTYSHSWGLPHESIQIGIWIHVNVFVIFFVLKTSNKRGSLTIPMRAACTLTSLCILFSARKLGFQLKILISIEFLAFGLRPRLPLMPYANPTSYSRLQTQDFTEILSFALSPN